MQSENKNMVFPFTDNRPIVSNERWQQFSRYRKRIGKGSGSEVFLFGEYDYEDDESDRSCCNTITSRYTGNGTGSYVIEREQKEREVFTKNNGYNADDTRLFAVKTHRTDECKRIRRQHMKHGKDWSPRRQQSITVREDSLMNTLTASFEINQAVATKNMDRIRRLTPIECERLMSFPDNWTKYGKDGNEISDAQRYKMLGNSVVVNVIKTIIERVEIK